MKCVLRSIKACVLGTVLLGLLSGCGGGGGSTSPPPERPRVPVYGQTMTTLQYSNTRMGWNKNESALNINNVNRAGFGKRWTAALEGEIFAAPLYVNGVIIGGQPRKAVYVATESNFIYALDADTGQFLWPAPYYFLDTPSPEAILPEGCGSLGPKIGITSTPVIDLQTGTLYAVGLTFQGDRPVYKMAAVDISTGRSQPGWPVIVDPPVQPRLDPRVNSNRGALVLANGIVYVPFGAYSNDCGGYHGWVVGVNTSNPTAPQMYYRTPGEAREDGPHGGGIWASGGLAADANGQIYAATGNSFLARELDYSNAVLRLGRDLSFSANARDFFTPSNWVELNNLDLDLGSSAPMLLPPQTGANTPNLIFVAGKGGIGHLINRDNLGGVARGDGVNREGVYSAKIYEYVTSTAAYYEDPRGNPFIFVGGLERQADCGIESGVVALALHQDAQGAMSFTRAWCSPSMSFAFSPVVTSAPGQTGILWAVDGGNGILYAMNADTGAVIYTSEQSPGDHLGRTNPFLHFTVMEGKVFVANAQSEIVAYGLRPPLVGMTGQGKKAGGYPNRAKDLEDAAPMAEESALLEANPPADKQAVAESHAPHMKDINQVGDHKQTASLSDPIQAIREKILPFLALLPEPWRSYIASFGARAQPQNPDTR